MVGTVIVAATVVTAVTVVATAEVELLDAVL
jgi:hypothetical protein